LDHRSQSNLSALDVDRHCRESGTFSVADGPVRSDRRTQAHLPGESGPLCLGGTGALHASLELKQVTMSIIFIDTLAARDQCAEESVGDLVALVQAEYDEMPGLVLTRPQLCRTFVLDPPMCDAVVHELVEGGVLVRVPNGSYARRRSVM
jgi:hypothetical protein